MNREELDPKEPEFTVQSDEAVVIAADRAGAVEALGLETTEELELPEPDSHRLYDDLLPATTDVFVRRDADAEASAELAAPSGTLIQPEDDRPLTAYAPRRGLEESYAGGMIGWIALILGISSLLVWPSILGPAAIVVGFMSYVRGRKALGVWSMVLGFIAFVTFLALLAYYR